MGSSKELVDKVRQTFRVYQQSGLLIDRHKVLVCAGELINWYLEQKEIGAMYNSQGQLVVKLHQPIVQRASSRNLNDDVIIPGQYLVNSSRHLFPILEYLRQQVPDDHQEGTFYHNIWQILGAFQDMRLFPLYLTDGRFIGYFILGRTSSIKEAQIEILEIFKPYRHCGLGKRAVQTIEQWLLTHEQECRSVQCEPVETALSFWIDKCGYQSMFTMEGYPPLVRKELYTH